jgi:hypothetical protein
VVGGAHIDVRFTFVDAESKHCPHVGICAAPRSARIGTYRLPRGLCGPRRGIRKPFKFPQRIVPCRHSRRASLGALSFPARAVRARAPLAVAHRMLQPRSACASACAAAARDPGGGKRDSLQKGRNRIVNVIVSPLKRLNGFLGNVSRATVGSVGPKSQNGKMHHGIHHVIFCIARIHAETRPLVLALVWTLLCFGQIHETERTYIYSIFPDHGAIPRRLKRK